ncbi:hypothetical protein [Photobacterium sp. OFAV2-7]|uniref:hypothetical protein n=1 Tax=Photobacterium sp. OFAV2-7 TaxID=2917748 RepID=UPI001EF7082B|nr:hypothetical protein [Photobacterium sp. OFAV2-7]MCG7588285.1 hypothetical protein [Photobacterium sp. OFAV2-7]
MKSQTVKFPEMTPDTMVQVTLGEIEHLRERNRTLEALEAAGVDNWEGYSEAMAMLHEDAA